MGARHQFLLGLLLVSVPAAVLGDLSSSSAPVVAWAAGKAAVSQAEQPVAVDYQARPAEESISELVLGALGKRSKDILPGVAAPLLSTLSSSSQKASTVVVVYVGKQVNSAALRTSGSGKLGALLSATQSLALPYATYMGNSLQGSLSEQLQKSGISFHQAGCSQASEDLSEDVRKALSSDAKVEVLMVCAPASLSLDEEVQQLEEITGAVEQAGKAALVVYANQPTQAAQRRRLQVETPITYSGFGPYTTCDAVCQTQVRWLEGMLAILFMALATCAGMTCLYLLNTPTRFESQKDSSTQQQ